MPLRDVSAERRRGQAAAITAAAEAQRKADEQRIGPYTVAQLRALTAAASNSTPEAFVREVQARRARDGVWDGRSTPTPAMVAAARRRQASPPTPAAPVQQPAAQGTTTTPQRFRAELAARRLADRERPLRP